MSKKVRRENTSLNDHDQTYLVFIHQQHYEGLAYCVDFHNFMQHLSQTQTEINIEELNEKYLHSLHECLTQYMDHSFGTFAKFSEKLTFLTP